MAGAVGQCNNKVEKIKTVINVFSFKNKKNVKTFYVCDHHGLLRYMQHTAIHLKRKHINNVQNIQNIHNILKCTLK